MQSEEIRKLRSLIKEVEDSKANIEQLKKLSLTHKRNKEYSSSNRSLLLKVYGQCECTATCISEDIFFNAVEAAIVEELEVMAKKYKLVEAMTLMSDE